MSYHDDGEQGLGPIVASLSLGADATMSFRRKQLKKSRAKGAKADGAESREKPSTKPVIKLQLRHGDVTIMEGRGVQRDLDVSRLHALLRSVAYLALTAHGRTRQSSLRCDSSVHRPRTQDSDDYPCFSHSRYRLPARTTSRSLPSSAICPTSHSTPVGRQEASQAEGGQAKAALVRDDASSGVDGRATSLRRTARPPASSS